MLILGLNVSSDQTAAVLLEDGNIVAGAAEERFNRIKRSRSFPYNSIQFCLDSKNLTDLRDLDAVAVCWNPARHIDHINMSGFTSWRRYDPEWFYIVPNNLRSFFKGDLKNNYSMLTMEGEERPRIIFVDHHETHLAFHFISPFESSSVCVLDEYGEYYSGTLAAARGKDIDILERIPFPHSLGIFYAAFTEFLGFTPNSDEWKVMGASALGDPLRFVDKLRDLISWHDNRFSFYIDQTYIEFANMKFGGYVTENMERYLGISRRQKDDGLEQEHFDLAAGVQCVFEEVLFKILTELSNRSGEKNLVASGGCFMNSLANGKILTETPFEHLFIPYAAADNGSAIGAALWAYYKVFDKKSADKKREIPSPYIGPSYGSEEVEDTIKRYKLRYSECDNPERTAAELIEQGKIVGWYQGGMEFGERALGNRSILADPRDKGMKDKINSAVKYREFFRPFAPSILEESVRDYFEIPEGVNVPYMEQVYPIKQEKHEIIPAVTHYDGTGRLQVVSKEMNGSYYKLIKSFEDITGIPIVLNTSFNIQGEPIVLTPSDAIRTFYTCGMDALIMDAFLLVK